MFLVSMSIFKNSFNLIYYDGKKVAIFKMAAIEIKVKLSSTTPAAEIGNIDKSELV